MHVRETIYKDRKNGFTTQVTVIEKVEAGLSLEKLLKNYKKEDDVATCTYNSRKHVVLSSRVMPNVRPAKPNNVTYNIEEVVLMVATDFAKTSLAKTDKV